METLARRPENYHPTLRMVEVAQACYDEPLAAHAHLGVFWQRLTEHFEQIGMMAANPDRARYLRERAVWDAALAPLLHSAELQLARAALPRIHAGLSLSDSVPRAGSTMFDDEAVYARNAKPYQGARGAFMYVGAIWSAYAAETTLRRARHTDLSLLFGNFSATHDDFCKYEGRLRPDFQRNPNPIEHFLVTMEDNNDSAVEILEQFQEHFTPDMSAEDCRTAFLTKVPEASWASSTNRHFVRKRLWDHYRDGGAHCPFAASAANLATQSIWSIASLRHGPWRVPGYCPANIPLCSPEPDAADIVAQLRALYGDFSTQPAISTTEMHMVFAAYLASETLWAEPVAKSSKTL